MLKGPGQYENNSAYDGIDGPDRPLEFISSMPLAPSYRRFLVDQLKARLRDMLAAQYSFGVIAGAPGVFSCD